MHVLVTGAGGFSGSHLTAAFLQAGHTVTAVVGRSRGRLDAVAGVNGLTVVSADLADGLTVPTGTDMVVHAAARSPGPGLTVSTGDFIRANTVATERLAAAASAASVPKFVYFSSISIFGQVRDAILSEESDILNPDSYGLSKRLGELVLDEYDFASLSLRLPGIIGPGAVRNWLATMAEQARDGRPIAFFNGAADYNNAVHIADLSTFVIGLAELSWNGADRVVLGAGGTMPVQALVEAIVAAGGGRSTLSEIPPVRPPFLLSSARAESLYGYRPMSIGPMLDRFLAECGLAPATAAHPYRRPQS